MVKFSVDARDIFLFKASGAKMGLTQPSVHWVLVALSPGVRRSVLELSSHRRPVPSLRINGALPPLAHMPS